MPSGKKAEAAADLKKRAGTIYKKLDKLYPMAKTALDHDNAYELLVATILSAQCTDERVNKTTPALFAKYPDPPTLAKSKQQDVEKIIHSCGFYRAKAKNIRGAAQKIVDDFGGKVPDTMDELLTLPGVARKTANCVLGNCFGKNEGVVVDTHVKRLSFRMGFTKHTDPVKIEKDLMAIFPQKNWTLLSHLLIYHGRRVCMARNPQCETCPINSLCPKLGV